MHFQQAKPQAELPGLELFQLMNKVSAPYMIHITHRLTCGRDHWAWRCGDLKATFTDFMLLGLQKHNTPAPIVAKLLSDQQKGLPVQPIINHGRWVAQCEKCREIGVVCLENPSFVCLNPLCLNIHNDYWPRPLLVPSAKLVRELNSILLARPNPINRNFDPTGTISKQEPDTIEKLIQENLNHGYSANIHVIEIGGQDGLEYA